MAARAFVYDRSRERALQRSEVGQVHVAVLVEVRTHTTARRGNFRPAYTRLEQPIVNQVHVVIHIQIAARRTDGQQERLDRLADIVDRPD